MTDKQIIIDGVDVSGCEHYKNRTCIADYCLTDMPFSEAKCELNSNCYYKQLKRKEQECEELKSVRDSWISKCEQETKIKELYQDGLNRLKAELEQSREAIAKIKGICEFDYTMSKTNLLAKSILQICDEVISE